MKNKLFAFLALAFLSTLDQQLSTVRAQGTAFTYQGRLIDGANPANGAYDLTFTLFNASSGGGTLGTSNVFNDLTISNGLFTVTLDFGAQFDGSARWLQIAIRPGPSTGAYTNVTPRQALTATPYASYAANANFASVAGTASTAGYASGAGTAADVIDGVVVKSLNGLRDNITLSPGANVTISPGGNTLTIASAGGSNSWALVGNNVTAGQFLGSTNNQALELKVNGARALRLEPATNVTTDDVNFFTNSAPNLIGGSVGNFVAPGVIGAVIAGGGTTNYFGGPATNSVSGDFGSIAGGLNNVVQAIESTIGGGGYNRIETTGLEFIDFGKTISGGHQNMIQNRAPFATIGGGYFNVIQTNSTEATIGGGHQNTIQVSGPESTIGGGFLNTIQTGAGFSTIGGGLRNAVSGRLGTVPGGEENLAGERSLAAGTRAKATHTGSFVWTDSTDADFGTTTSNQFLVRATGGLGIGTTNPLTQLTVAGSGAYNSRSAAAITLDNTTPTTGRRWEWHVIDDGRLQLADFTLAATRLVVDTTGKVGIGAPSPSFQLQLSTDSAGKPNGGSWANTSDARVKKNIRPLSGALDKLMQLRGVNFEWVNPEDHANQHGAQGGFVAQEVERSFPHWITPVAAAEHDKALTDDGKIKSLALPFEFDALVVEAIKEQQQQIKARDAEIGELKQRLDAMEKLVNRLTTTLTSK